MAGESCVWGLLINSLSTVFVGIAIKDAVFRGCMKFSPGLGGFFPFLEKYNGAFCQERENVGSDLLITQAQSIGRYLRRSQLQRPHSLAVDGATGMYNRAWPLWMRWSFDPRLAVG
jgi:hypothetical protein